MRHSTTAWEPLLLALFVLRFLSAFLCFFILNTLRFSLCNPTIQLIPRVSGTDIGQPLLFWRSRRWIRTFCFGIRSLWGWRRDMEWNDQCCFVVCFEFYSIEQCKELCRVERNEVSRTANPIGWGCNKYPCSVLSECNCSKEIPPSSSPPFRSHRKLLTPQARNLDTLKFWQSFPGKAVLTNTNAATTIPGDRVVPNQTDANRGLRLFVRMPL